MAAARIKKTVSEVQKETHRHEKNIQNKQK